MKKLFKRIAPLVLLIPIVLMLVYISYLPARPPILANDIPCRKNGADILLEIKTALNAKPIIPKALDDVIKILPSSDDISYCKNIKNEILFDNKSEFNLEVIHQALDKVNKCMLILLYI